jgi:hypothetical protein
LASIRCAATPPAAIAFIIPIAPRVISGSVIAFISEPMPSM